MSDRLLVMERLENICKTDIPPLRDIVKKIISDIAD
jgi:hypothetical protein